ncbi:FG-GAP-like repeat-containing protein [Pseudoxanthomonas sacheonensis]|uniref:Repeat domain-containing protein n=1 Tax=Pseudoxanthomonas sacheonensis TaxID=443615 RepID=A0ABU1RXD1_9GAMM|nr:FG-GAP-like repeat-containing protein [Pseudoxanthomonas sacheonensis]MDR6843312.1 hypothetical protein [Pseudoxanthomonas sacheonensis]
MKFRVGACALLVCLAGCTAEAPNTKFGDQKGAASANGRTAQRLPSVQAGRQASRSVANAPDHGELISYKNKGAAIKREGAYTWYPVAISEAHALKAVVDGVMSIPSPDGSQVKVRYERHVEHPDGNWTWIGRVIGGDQKQEAILTFGEDAVYGSIPQMAGAPLSLQTRGGQLYAVQTDLSKVKNPNSRTDMMVPPALALRSALLKSAPKAQVSQSAVETKAASAANTIDIVIGYTAGFATARGSQSAAVTQLVYLVDVGNQAFTNSLITGALRIVNTVQVNYTDTTTNKAALGELTGYNGTATVPVPASLAPIRTARDQYGADLAVLVRKFQTPENDGCGIAWLNGSDQTAIDPATDDDFGFAVISDGNDTGTDGNGYFCAPETMVHELAHLMGSAHDRDNSKKDDGSLLYGRYPYSFGMKTTEANGNFYTIMAYGDNNQNFYRTFSNPLVLKCGPAGSNLACGVANQTDNARSLNQTIPVVATFRNTVVPIAGKARNDINGDGKSDLIFRNASVELVGWWEMNGAVATNKRNRSVSSAYTLGATGDFNGDGKADLAWTNSARQLIIQTSTGTALNSTVVTNDFGAGWTLVGAGDISGDGKSDLIFRNASAQLVSWWEMNGTTVTTTRSRSVSSPYTLTATGDFNGDGRTDLVWTNAARQLIIQISTGAALNSVVVVNDFGAGWTSIGAGDISGDGRADLIFRNVAAQLVGWWEMNGTTVITTRSRAVSTPYTLSATGDFNGDQKTDLAWTNASRQLIIQTSTGTALNSTVVTNDFGAGWSLLNGGR